MSTGIGPDIDIVMNELDALVNIIETQTERKLKLFKYYQNWNFRFSAS
jgi:hypothetical protein